MLTLLPTPIGNIEDISIRALRVLEEAHILLCEDTRVAKKLLKLLEERHGLNHKIEKFISFHSHNEDRVLASLEPSFFEKNIVYMSDAGMPCISDPGAVLVEYCQRHGIDYTVLPGPTAFATAYAASGFTQGRFIFYGFLPHKGSERRGELQKLLTEPYAVILYEAPHRFEKLLDELEQHAPERVVFAAKEISKKHEHFFKGCAKELKEQISGALLKGEWVVILSPSVQSTQGNALSAADIEALDIPPKQKAKLLSKVTGLSVKECYERVLTEKK